MLLSLWRPRSPGCAHLLTRWRRDRRGAVAISFALTLVLMMAALLFAIDMGRAHVAATRLQSALDAAALAGTRDLRSASFETDVRQVFDANFADAGLGAEVTRFEVTPVEDDHGVRRLRLEAEARLASPLGALLEVADLDWLRVAAENQTVRDTHGIELVMVLDNTGSMRSGGKDGDLRAAARALTDVLFGEADSKPHLWVGIVPYTATVNIGAYHKAWLDDLAASDAPPWSWEAFAPSEWKGCVLARADGGDRTDDPPADDPFDPYFWPSMEDPDADYSMYDDPRDPHDGGGPRLNVWPDEDGWVDEGNAAQNSGYGPNLGCGPEILPLTPSRAEVEAKIAEMEPWHRGGTMANVGLAWGWRALSPRWRGLWSYDENDAIPAALPLDHDEPYMSKVIVLMTDGDNQWYKRDYTAYRYPDDDLLAGTGVDERMLQACELLKQDGIVIYAITFGTGVNSATADLYRDCASAPDQNVYFPGRKYFDAPTGDDLRAAFGAIGGQLTELRLTQ
ncbi:MAG: pilus assembly protein TadG-related protein [Alphaproteobacteria bacterium]